MKILDTLLTSSAIQMFGWTIFHSLWQGIILAILLKAAFNLTKKLSANTRYLISCITLLLMMLLPVTTVFLSNSVKQSIDSAKTNFQITDSSEKAITAADKSFKTNISKTEFSYNLWWQQIERLLLPWIVLIWFIGVVISSLRLVGVWIYTQRLKLNGKHLVLEQWTETVQKLCQQLSVSRPVMLLESSLVKVPTVIGWIKPVILIPSCALTGLTPQQFELILAHELAHIRRYDYLVNLFQTIIETFLFYHPCVWWVSNRIRNERENACDDLAISISGDAVVYARTLTTMERLRKTDPSLTMAADGSSLTHRVHRLLGAEKPNSNSFAGLWVALFISVIMFTAAVTKHNSFVMKESPDSDLLLDLPPLTIEDLYEGARASQNTMTGEWTAQFNPEKSGEIQLKIQKRSKKGGINGSINTLSLSDLSGLSPEAEVRTKIAANFQIIREAGTLVFEGNFNEGKGTGLWKLTPNQSFVSDLRNLGYDNLPENYLFYAATENITTKFINDLEVAGYQLSFKELIQAASYKITPESIRVWRSEGFNNISFEELVKLGENDVTLEFLKEIKAEGFPQISLSQAVKLRTYEIDRNFIQQVRASGYPNVTLDALIDLRMRISNK